MKCIFFILCFMSTQAFALSFSQAKKQLPEIYHLAPKSFYCGCPIKTKGKKLTPQWKACGFSPRKQQKRASRIEWEHLVPAWEFGHQRKCWQKGGRKHCRKNDPVFAQMEGDLHNLVPAIGEVNGDRSNFKFGMIQGESRVYGKCDAEVAFKQKVFEPASTVRGDIARTYFYFQQQYGLKISKKQRKLLTVWDQQDPVDQQECRLHKEKARRQGQSNALLVMRCKKYAQGLSIGD